MNPTRVEVRDIQTWTLIYSGWASDILLHKSGTVSVPRTIVYEGQVVRNGWYGYRGTDVIVLFWP